MNINAIKEALNTRAAHITKVPVPSTKSAVKDATLADTIPPSAMTATSPESKPANEKSSRRTSTKKAAAINTTNTSIESIEKIVAAILIPNQDYGVIQGCRKPSLLKSGAEKLCAYYGYSTKIAILHRAELYEKNFVSYEVKVTIYDPAGSIQAEGLGAANSRERKFLKGDFFSQINTVLKMAKKRAFVDAILTATSASGIFTQDMEDIATTTNTASEMEAIG